MKSRPYASAASQLDPARRAEYRKSEEYLALPEWLRPAAEHEHMLKFYMDIRTNSTYAKEMVKRYKPTPDQYHNIRAANYAINMSAYRRPRSKKERMAAEYLDDHPDATKEEIVEHLDNTYVNTATTISGEVDGRSKPWSAERRAAQSARVKGTKRTPEQRKAMSDAMKDAWALRARPTEQERRSKEAKRMREYRNKLLRQRELEILTVDPDQPTPEEGLAGIKVYQLGGAESMGIWRTQGVEAWVEHVIDITKGAWTRERIKSFAGAVWEHDREKNG